MIELNIDLQSPLPIYAQIQEQIKRRIARGQLLPGQKLPPVRELAQQLGVNPNTVGRAYLELEREGILSSQQGRGTFVATSPQDQRLAQEREERLVTLASRALIEALSRGYSPTQIEAAFSAQLARWRDERQARPENSPPAERTLEQTVILAGSHDLALEILAGHFQRGHPQWRLNIMTVGSLGGLIALQRGEAHVAGCHLLDEETGEYNTAYVKHLFPAQDVMLITLLHREQGIMVARGNPKGITGLRDLLRNDITFINRQIGSGTRVLIDYNLHELGIAPQDIKGYEREADTHLAVAAAITSGAAAGGVCILAAAKATGLGFIPLHKERSALAIPSAYSETPPIKALLDIVKGNEFKAVVEQLGGYDVSESGAVRRVG